MKRFKNILFVVSGAPANRLALSQAVNLSRQNYAQLTIMIAARETPPDWEFAAVMERHLREQAEQELAEVVAEFELDAELPKPTIIFKQGEPFIEVVRQAISESHDMVVKAADPTEDRSRIGFVSMDMHLFRKCPCPIWLFKPHKNSSDKLRLMAAIDPSHENETSLELTRKIMELSTSLRERLPNSSLDVLHAWSYEHEDTLTHNPFLRVPEERLAELVEEAKVAQRRAFDESLVAFDLAPDSVESLFLKGPPTEVIPETIKERNTDILVMGTVARTGIQGLLIGNTAETILRHTDCSVLAVKPKGFTTPVTP
ncbi:MAG: universal stress protein [Verrucomicrobiota bacterium]